MKLILWESRQKRDAWTTRRNKMAKTKSELLQEAKMLDLDVTTKNTVAEISAAIKSVASSKQKVASGEGLEVKDTQEVIADDNGPAKAGKRSAKAIAQTEEKRAKEERKASGEAQDTPKPKTIVTPTRSRLERRGKAYKEASKLIEKDKEYTIKEAMSILVSTSGKKFDSTAELHTRLGVNPKHADQNIRDSIVLPEGTGKKLKVAVFADEQTVAKAGKIEAFAVGEEVIMNLLTKGEIEFDILIATPNMMQKLAKFAKLLGPKGLMPNPKSGTVTNDIAKAASEANAGRVEYRVDSSGIVHIGFGKISFGESKLTNNLTTLLTSIKSNKPSSVK